VWAIFVVTLGNTASNPDGVRAVCSINNYGVATHSGWDVGQFKQGTLCATRGSMGHRLVWGSMVSFEKSGALIISLYWF